MDFTTLTSDRYFLLTFLFWMFAGCILIVPIVMTGITASQVIWGPRFDWQIMGFLKSLGLLALALIIAWGAFRLGLRDREVVLAGDTVQIRWGATMPLTLRSFDAATLEDFSVTKEARYSLSPRAGSPRYGYTNVPDRWRLTASVNGRKVNLGSYETEEAANKTITAIQTAGK